LADLENKRLHSLSIKKIKLQGISEKKESTSKRMYMVLRYRDNVRYEDVCDRA
jgi:hypothetical protein